MRSLAFEVWILGVLIGGSLGLSGQSPGEGGEESPHGSTPRSTERYSAEFLARYRNLARQQNLPEPSPHDDDVYLPPDIDWDEDLAARSISPNAYPANFSPLKPRSPTSETSKRLYRRQDIEPLEIMSFNMQPDVGGDDPVALRKNPARMHQEFFCHWRTPVDNYDIRTAYEVVTDYLEEFPMDYCSGPGGYCTPVYCIQGFLITACNWNDKPWQIFCSDLMTQAQDLVIALSNKDPVLWQDGINQGRSARQKANDQKKLCIDHSSVYTPEMLGYTWFNTNPHFQVRLYYGLQKERVPCLHPGKMHPDVLGKAKAQEWYMQEWYGILQPGQVEDLLNGTNPNPKRPPGNKPAPTITDRNSTFNGTFPLPVEIPTGTGGAANYRGPNLKDYDPLEFIPPGQVGQYLYEKGITKKKSKTKSRTAAAKETGMARNATITSGTVKTTIGAGGTSAKETGTVETEVEEIKSTRIPTPSPQTSKSASTGRSSVEASSPEPTGTAPSSEDNESPSRTTAVPSISPSISPQPGSPTSGLLRVKSTPISSATSEARAEPTTEATAEPSPTRSASREPSSEEGTSSQPSPTATARNQRRRRRRRV
ncbi:hypothetical protein ABW19_dt0203733 [Dactylella cylindrospora]|nr:hypothetical protein ABW19_dt0203733 [Dactylella cylindrospora]